MHECEVGAGGLLSEVMESLARAPSQVSCKETLAQAAVSLSVSGMAQKLAIEALCL